MPITRNLLTRFPRPALLRKPLQPVRWLSGRKRRFAKALYGLNRTEGSNPSLTASFPIRERAFAGTNTIAFTCRRSLRSQNAADKCRRAHETTGR